MKVLDFDGKNKNQIQANISMVLREMENLKQWNKLIAEYKKNLFDEYVAAGFSKSQAVELCRD